MSENAAFNLSAFLISSALTYGYSPYSRKLGHWCSRTNLMNAGAFVFQSSGKPSRFYEDGGDAGLREEGHGILGVFVEVGVEDALIHEVGFSLDVEEHPAQVVELEHGEAVRLARHRFLDVLAVFTDGLLPARVDLRDDREAIARGGPGERSGRIFPVRALKYPSFGIAIAAGFDQSFCLGVSDICVSFLC